MAKIILKELLEDRGIKNSWLADKLGISSAALSKLLNGKTDSIRYDYIEKICAELSCEIQDFIVLDAENNSQKNKP